MEFPWFRSRKQGHTILSVGDVAFSCLISLMVPFFLGLLVGSPIRELGIGLTIFAALTLPIGIVVGLVLLKLGVAGLIPTLLVGWLTPVIWFAVFAVQDIGWHSAIDLSLFTDAIIPSMFGLYYAGTIWGFTYWQTPQAFCRRSSTINA